MHGNVLEVIFLVIIQAVALVVAHLNCMKPSNNPQISHPFSPSWKPPIACRTHVLKVLLLVVRQAVALVVAHLARIQGGELADLPRPQLGQVAYVAAGSLAVCLRGTRE